MSFPDPEATSTLLNSIRRWAGDLRSAEAGSTELESMIVRFAEELRTERNRDREFAEQRFVDFYRKCPTGVALADSAGRATAINPAFLHLLGRTDPAEVIGTALAELGNTERDRAVLRLVLAEVAADGDEVREHVELTTATGLVKLVRLTATTLPGDGTAYPVLMVEDVQDLHQLRETFQHQGLHDPLTGLPNLAYFRSTLEGRLGTNMGPGPGGRIAVLFFDLDGFKVINDGLGAEAGDQILRGVADTLGKVFAERDAFVARLFGDRFAVALRGSTRPAEVVALAEEVTGRLGRATPLDGIGIGVSASVGIALADPPGPDHGELMRSAELALHRAKELGKAQWVLYDAESGRRDRDRNRLACAIAGALENGELSVAYQPHAVLPEARVLTSVNATLRWNHPTLGRLRPERFYPLAETTGMTVPLGRYLLTEALRTAADWRRRFADDAPLVCLTLPRRIAIDGDLVGLVRTELDRNELAPNQIMLCTDGPSLLDERGDVLESIGHLARLGVLFVLNISGPSELELVPALRVPARAVMVGGPLIDELGVDDPPEWARRSVRQLVARAEEIGVKVGAHGVRSPKHAELLHDLGVVVGSGSFLPEHVDRTEAETWVGRTYPMG